MVQNNLKIDIVLNCIRSNKKPITLVKTDNLSKSLISYYLRVLKSKNIIRNIGKGVWEIVQELPNVTGTKKVRAHAFIWKIKLRNKINWIEILTKLNIPYINTGKAIRIVLKGKKIWLCNKSIIIYEPKSFYATLPLETRKLAIYELISTINGLESKLNINLGKYQFSVKREHYSLIKNDLANQCNKNGEKIRVRDNGELWFEIDNSYNLDEAEFYKTKTYSGLVNSTGAQGYFNSHKDTNWKVTPEFILNVMNGIQKNQLIFDKNMKSHLEVLNKIGDAIDRLGKVKKKKVSLQKFQTTLGDY